MASPFRHGAVVYHMAAFLGKRQSVLQVFIPTSPRSVRPGTAPASAGRPLERATHGKVLVCRCVAHALHGARALACIPRASVSRPLRCVDSAAHPTVASEVRRSAVRNTLRSVPRNRCSFGQVSGNRTHVRPDRLLPHVRLRGLTAALRDPLAGPSACPLMFSAILVICEAASGVTQPVCP